MLFAGRSPAFPCHSEKTTADTRRLAQLDDIFWDAAVRLATVCRHVPSPEYCKSIEELSFQTILNHAKTEGVQLSLPPRRWRRAASRCSTFVPNEPSRPASEPHAPPHTWRYFALRRGRALRPRRARPRRPLPRAPRRDLRPLPRRARAEEARRHRGRSGGGCRAVPGHAFHPALGAPPQPPDSARRSPRALAPRPGAIPAPGNPLLSRPQLATEADTKAAAAFLLDFRPVHLQWTPAKKKGEWHHALCLMMTSVLAQLQARPRARAAAPVSLPRASPGATCCDGPAATPPFPVSRRRSGPTSPSAPRATSGSRRCPPSSRASKTGARGDASSPSRPAMLGPSFLFVDTSRCPAAHPPCSCSPGRPSASLF